MRTVRTRGREVKNLIITCINILNGWPLTVPFLWKTYQDRQFWSYSILFKFILVSFLYLYFKQTGFFSRLFASPRQVSSAIKCLKVTLSEVVNYLFYNVEIKTVESLSIDLLCFSKKLQYRLLRKLFCYFYICHRNTCSHE